MSLPVYILIYFGVKWSLKGAQNDVSLVILYVSNCGKGAPNCDAQWLTTKKGHQVLNDLKNFGGAVNIPCPRVLTPPVTPLSYVTAYVFNMSLVVHLLSKYHRVCLCVVPECTDREHAGIQDIEKVQSWCHSVRQQFRGEIRKKCLFKMFPISCYGIPKSSEK